jgi:hypothetical protein
MQTSSSASWISPGTKSGEHTLSGEQPMGSVAQGLRKQRGQEIAVAADGAGKANINFAETAAGQVAK